YYLPGAVIREFAAVMRDHLRIHLVAALVTIVLTLVFTAWIVPTVVVPSSVLRASILYGIRLDTVWQRIANRPSSLTTHTRAIMRVSDLIHNNPIGCVAHETP